MWCASSVVGMSDPTFGTIIEPFRIHSVEPLRMTTRQQREAALSAAGYNLFKVHAGDVGAGTVRSCRPRLSEIPNPLNRVPR